MVMWLFRFLALFIVLKYSYGNWWSLTAMDALARKQKQGANVSKQQIHAAQKKPFHARNVNPFNRPFQTATSNNDVFQSGMGKKAKRDH